MPELSLNNIDQISMDVRNQEITFSHLLEDLTDHICCDVEYEMQRGLSFAEAYRIVKNKMGPRRIKEIQEETLFTVDTKYRNMKRTMRISGVAGTILMGFAAMFKIQHWPYAGIMLTLGALILAFVFMPSALGVLWKESHNKKRILLFISAFLTGMFFIFGTLFKIQHWPLAGFLLLLAALSGIFLFIPSLTLSKLQDEETKAKRPVYVIGALGIILFALGFLFKIQHWPFSLTLLTVGVVIICAIALPWFTWSTWKNESHITVSFVFMIISSLIIIVPGVLINLNLANSYENEYYSHQWQQQALSSALYSDNLSFVNQYRDSAQYKKMSEIHSKTSELLSLIGNIQTKMVADSEGKPGIREINPNQIKHTEMGTSINYWFLSGPFKTSPVKNFLLKGCSSREELDAALTEYLHFITMKSSEENYKIYDVLLKPSNILPNALKEGSEISMMAGLHSTELLKNSILTAESSALKNITGK